MLLSNKDSKVVLKVAVKIMEVEVSIQIKMKRMETHLNKVVQHLHLVLHQIIAMTMNKEKAPLLMN
jgi:hypothetical protein